MSLASSVNCVFWEIQSLENKVRKVNPSTPKFINEVRRLTGLCHQLHWDAHHLDEYIRVARCLDYNSQLGVREIQKRIYLMRQEIVFVDGDLAAFTYWDRNPPRNTTIFSSPSNSPGSTPGSVYFDSPVRQPQQKVYLQPFQSSQSSGCSGYSSQGSQSGGNRFGWSGGRY